MNHFGMPLVPAALALWAINFIDRLLHRRVQGPGRGRRLLRRRPHLVGDRLPDDRVPHGVARVRVLDRGRPRGAPDVLVRAHLRGLRHAAGSRSRSACSRRGSCTLLARQPGFYRASDAVALLSFAGAAYAGYTVLAIGTGRARKTQCNWVVAGVAAAVNVGAERHPDPALRDDRRRDRDRRRLRRAVRRHGRLLAGASTPSPTSGAAWSPRRRRGRR